MRKFWKTWTLLRKCNVGNNNSKSRRGSVFPCGFVVMCVAYPYSWFGRSKRSSQISSPLLIVFAFGDSALVDDVRLSTWRGCTAIAIVSFKKKSNSCLKKLQAKYPPWLFKPLPKIICYQHTKKQKYPTALLKYARSVHKNKGSYHYYRASEYQGYFHAVAMVFYKVIHGVCLFLRSLLDQWRVLLPRQSVRKWPSCPLCAKEYHRVLYQKIPPPYQDW